MLCNEFYVALNWFKSGVWRNCLPLLLHDRVRVATSQLFEIQRSDASTCLLLDLLNQQFLSWDLYFCFEIAWGVRAVHLTVDIVIHGWLLLLWHRSKAALIFFPHSQLRSSTMSFSIDYDVIIRILRLSRTSRRSPSRIGYGLAFLEGTRRFVSFTFNDAHARGASFMCELFLERSIAR